jgi:hypothetical protein
MQVNQWPDVKSWAEHMQKPDVKAWAEHMQWPDVKGWAEHKQWHEMNWPKKPGWQQKKRWSDFSTRQKVCLILMAVVQIGLLIAGLWDLAHRKPDEVRGPKAMWWGIMFVNWVGPIAYFSFGRKYGACTEGTTELAEPPVI